MKKFVTYILLFSLLLVQSCSNSHEPESKPINETDLEIEIINTVLPLLVPDYPLGSVSPPPREGSLNNAEEIQNWRLKDSLSKNVFHIFCDSIGMTVSLKDSMDALNCNVAQWLFSEKDVHPLFKKYIDQPIENKRLDLDRIHEFRNVKIIHRKKNDFEYPENFIGEIQISRIVFNENKNEAAFIFSCLSGGCIPVGPINYVVVQKQKGKWVIIEK